MKKILLTLVFLVPTFTNAALIPIDWAAFPTVDLTVHTPAVVQYSVPYNPITVEFPDAGGFSLDLLPNGFFQIVILQEIAQEIVFDLAPLNHASRTLNGLLLLGQLFPGLAYTTASPDQIGLTISASVAAETKWDIEVIQIVPEPSSAVLLTIGCLVVVVGRITGKRR